MASAPRSPCVAPSPPSPRARGPGLQRIGPVLVLIASLAGPATGCSLHYDQQVDGQTLDLEVMRPVPVNRPATDKESKP